MPINIHKSNSEIRRLLKDSNLATKVYIYMSTKSVGEDFDPEEANYTYTNLNPQVVRGYVKDIKGEALVWKNYGLSETGAKEVICEYKYAEWFRLANKIEIDSDEYQVYKENVGNRMLIEKRSFSLARIILKKVQ
jgi:hypothetical protein